MNRRSSCGPSSFLPRSNPHSADQAPSLADNLRLHTLVHHARVKGDRRGGSFDDLSSYSLAVDVMGGRRRREGGGRVSFDVGRRGGRRRVDDLLGDFGGEVGGSALVWRFGCGGRGEFRRRRRDGRVGGR